jgi:hypothetical protein
VILEIIFNIVFMAFLLFVLCMLVYYRELYQNPFYLIVAAGYFRRVVNRFVQNDTRSREFRRERERHVVGNFGHPVLAMTRLTCRLSPRRESVVNEAPWCSGSAAWR